MLNNSLSSIHGTVETNAYYCDIKSTSKVQEGVLLWKTMWFKILALVQE